MEPAFPWWQDWICICHTGLKISSHAFDRAFFCSTLSPGRSGMSGNNCLPVLGAEEPGRESSPSEEARAQCSSLLDWWEKHHEVLHQENCKPWGRSMMPRLPYKLNNFGFWWVDKEESKEKEKRRRCWKSPAMFLKTSIQLEMSITLIQGRKCKRGKTQRIGGDLKFHIYAPSPSPVFPFSLNGSEHGCECISQYPVL